VNKNRFKEGARVLEDIARFVFQDLSLFQKIKNLKHHVKINNLTCADNNDIGGPTFKENNNRENLLDIINANALRMQESSRVLEELDDAVKFKKIRFTAYDIHQQIIKKYNESTQVSKLKGIYPICDPTSHSLTDMVNYLNKSESTICQLRMKNAAKTEIYAAAKKFKTLLCSDIILIINDHVDIALMAADGVHVGQDDLPVKDIRRITPHSFIIGCSCHNLSEAQQAQSEGASYISLGCIFPTKTKQDTTPISLESVEKVSQIIEIPVCVIGGINSKNINKLFDVGINFFAMRSGVWTS